MQAVQIEDLAIAASAPAGTAASTVTVAAAVVGKRVLVTYCHVAKGTLATSIIASFGGTLTVAAETATLGFTYAAGVNPGFTQVQGSILGPTNTDFRVVLVGAGAGFYLVSWCYITG